MLELKGRVLVYSISGCPHCKAAKSKLSALDLPYDDVNLDSHPDQREIMTKLTGRITVPQIFFNERHVGGNDDFQALSDEELNELIAYVRDNEPPGGAPQANFDDSTEANGGDDAYDEMDVLASLVEELRRQSGIIKNHRGFFTSNPKSFIGEDVITFVAHEKQTGRPEALKVAQQLIEEKFIVPVKHQDPIKDDKTLYRLIQDQPSKAFNAGLDAYSANTSASSISTAVRKCILSLYNEYLSDDGKAVDYDGIAKSSKFQDYITLTGQLQRVQLKDLLREEKLAFFINIYNALVIHGNIKIGFPNTIWQRYKFFKTASYSIGGHVYTLEEIENGVLRSNRKGVGMLSRPFKPNDPRYSIILDPVEPLIHFALVCGAHSCPPIKTYAAEGVMDQLSLAAAAFLESDDGCRVMDNLVGLSRIFKWYQEDFGESQHEVLKWVVDNSPPGEKRDQIEKLLESKKYKLEYLHYDWGANTK